MKITKKIVVIFFGTLALIYTVSGVFCYKKSFRKKKSLFVIKNSPVLDTTKIVLFKEIYFDYEDSSNKSINNEKSFSGKKSLCISPDKEFDAEVVTPFSEFLSGSVLKS